MRTVHKVRITSTTLIVEKHDIVRWAGESKHWPAGGTLREMHYDEDEEVFKLVVDAPDDKTP